MQEFIMLIIVVTMFTILFKRLEQILKNDNRGNKKRNV